MAKYRERGSDGEIPPTSRTDREQAQAVFDLDNLAAEYGLDNMMPSGDNPRPNQSIDEEYNSYTTAQLSSKDTDPLKFWVVSFRN